MALIAAVLLLFLLSGMIIVFTPLRTLLPGYMKEAQRDHTMATIVRLDSLQRAYDENQAYLDNIMTLLDTNRQPSDSASLTANVRPLTADSLIEASSVEKDFVKMMEQREKYNISILAPMAAEGMMFDLPAPGGSFAVEDINSESPIINMPKGGIIITPAEGRVIDVGYDASSGYVVVIQHGKGFVSRLSRLGTPMVRKGDRINSGQVVARQGDSKGLNSWRIRIEMWRNGDVLIPYDLIYPSER
jgi:hypothetical protein